MTRIRTNTATTQGIVVGTAYVVRHPEPEGEPHVADSATDALSERTRFERALADVYKRQFPLTWLLPKTRCCAKASRRRSKRV